MRIPKTTLPGSCALLLLVGLAACSGPIETRSGLAGAPVASATAVALVPLPESASAESLAARTAVAEALGRYGYRLADDAPLRIDVALAERAAAVAVRALAGPALSPAKRQRLLQDCHDQTHRLTLAAYDPARPGVTRVWAEEHHCNGTLAASLPALADQAVAALTAATPERMTLRAGRD